MFARVCALRTSKQRITDEDVKKLRKAFAPAGTAERELKVRNAEDTLDSFAGPINQEAV